MELDEVAQVLAKCSAYDLRTVGRSDVAAWAEIIGSVDLPDALDAVTRHYRESSDRAMPADILRHSKAAKRDRLRSEGARSLALALPGKWESDADRDARKAARRAEVRAAIPQPRSKPADEMTAWDALCAITTAPVWPDPEETP